MTSLTVVKLGGSLLENASSRHLALEAIADRWHEDSRIVVVHGGGKHIDLSLAKLGIPKRTVEGLRVTDAATLEVVTGVLGGLVNKTIVTELSLAGIAAAGISGADGETLQAELHAPVDGVDVGYVGKVSACDPALALTLLGAGFLPVIASLASSSEGQLLNVNADSAAAAIAVALGATRLVFLTDVEGVIDPTGSILPSLGITETTALLASSSVTGGMKPKLRACLDALEGGVAEVIIAGPSRHGAALAGGEGGTHLVAA